MRRKMLSMLFVAAVLLALFGCRKEPAAREEPPEVTRETQPGEVPETQPGTARETRPGAVPETQPGAARETQPTTVGEAGQPGQPAGALAQQREQYIQGAEQALTKLEQQTGTWEQQAGAQEGQAQEKFRQLQQRFEQELADARTALEKMKIATGDDLQQAKVAADQAIADTQQAFKELQSFVESQRQVTRAE
jgi:hypothetical protein